MLVFGEPAWPRVRSHWAWQRGAIFNLKKVSQRISIMKTINESHALGSTAPLFEPNEAQLTRLKRWRTSTFFVMLVGYVGYYCVRGNLAVALPLLNQTFGYSNSQLGMILTFSELAYAFGKFTTGPLADSIGGK